MNGMEITKELKHDIELNQTQLIASISNKQNCLAGLELDPHNVTLQTELNKAEEAMVTIGLEQKKLLDRLGAEYKAYQKSLKAKNGSQNIANQSASTTSFSNDSTENISPNNPIEPQDVTQLEFLNYFSLTSQEAYKEMKNKRAQRKRRSTTNPHFSNKNNKGWDLLTNNKRKRNSLFNSLFSLPHIHQKKNQERNPAPLTNATPIVQVEKSKSEINLEQNINESTGSTKSLFTSSADLPNGPITERVSPSSSSSLDNTTYVSCEQPESLPLTNTTHQSPQNTTEETRTFQRNTSGTPDVSNYTYHQRKLG